MQLSWVWVPIWTPDAKKGAFQRVEIKRGQSDSDIINDIDSDIDIY